MPVASSSTTRTGRPPGTGGRFVGLTQGSPGSGAPIAYAPDSHDEEALDWLVDRPPLVLVRLVAAQEVEAPTAGGDGGLDRRRAQEHAWRQLARLGVHPGVVEVPGIGVLEPDAGRDPPAGDGQEVQLDRPVVAEQLEEATEEGPALVAARRRREEPLGAPALLVQVDERVQVADGIGGSLEADRAGGLRPAQLAADLVALLLVERPEVALEVDPGQAR